jgi:hypothetical protein
MYVKHINGCPDVFAVDETDAYVFASSLHACISRVKVQVKSVRYVPRHHRTPDEMNVFKSVYQACNIVHINKRGFPVSSRVEIKDQWRSPASAHMDALASDLQVMC